MRSIKALCILLAILFVVPKVFSAKAADSYYMNFNSAASLSSISDVSNATLKYLASEGAMLVTATADKPSFSFSKSGLGAYDFAVLTYKANSKSTTTAAFEGTLFLYDGTSCVFEDYITYTRGYKAYSAVVDISSAGNADKATLRVFNDCSAGDSIYIYSIEFCSDAASAEAAAEENATRANGDVVSKYSESTLKSNKYVWDEYMIPYWDADLIINEAVYPLQNKNGTLPDYELMYSADRIISVKSSSLGTEYKEGVDYELVNGKLRILSTGSIPTVNYSRHYYTYSASGTYQMKVANPSMYVRFQEGPSIPNDQIAVTYTHSDEWSGFIPPNQGEALPRTNTKLENGQNLNIVFFGDSITNGGNSSGNINMAPYAEMWTTMFERELKSLYPTATISCENTSVSGGSWNPEAVDNVRGSIIAKSPDLVVLALGTNDYQFEYSASSTYNCVSTVVDSIKSALPNCEIILVAPMLSNPECFRSSLLDEYIAGYRKKAAQYDGVVIADVNSVHKYLLTKKFYTDLSANNLCHLNDTFARVYAQVLIKTITPENLTSKYRATVKTRLDAIADLSDYSAANQAKISSIIAKAKNDVDSVSTYESAQAIFREAKKQILVLPSLSNMSSDEQLAAAFDFKNLKFNRADSTSLVNFSAYVNYSYSSAEKALAIKAQTNNQKTRVRINYPKVNQVSAYQNKYVVFTYKVPKNTSSTAKTSRLYFCSGDLSSYTESSSVTFNVTKDGTFHSEIINLSNLATWRGPVLKLQIAPFIDSLKNDTMYVYSVSMCRDRSEAEAVATASAAEANGIITGGMSFTKFDNASSMSFISSPEITTYVGDVFTDGAMNAHDVAALCEVLVGMYYGDNISLVDVNKDGFITAKDVATIKLVLVGKVPMSYTTARSRACSTTFNPASSSVRIEKGIGKYATLSTDANFRASRALIVYNSDSDVETEVFFGDSTDAPSVTASFAAGEKKSLLLSLPDGFDKNCVTIKVDGISLDIVSFGLFEKSADADQYVGDIGDDDDPTVIHFDEIVEIPFDADILSKVTYSNHASYSATDGGVRFTVSGDRIDPYVYFDLSSYNLSADDYKYIVYKYMVPTSVSTRATKAQIFFCSDNAAAPAENSSQVFSIEKTGSNVSKTINLSSASYWGGSISGLRLDFFCDASLGDVCNVNSITFCKTAEDAARAAANN